MIMTEMYIDWKKQHLKEQSLKAKDEPWEKKCSRGIWEAQNHQKLGH